MDDFEPNDDYTFTNPAQLRTALETQLSELEMLQSVFCNPGEIHLDNYGIIDDMTDYINNKTDEVPICLDFTVNLQIENINFEICVTLPHDYPETEPDIFVRNNKQNREQQRQLNNDLRVFIKNLEKGVICVYSAVTWLQENSAKYGSTVEDKSTEKSSKNSGTNECARYWIYSHHIYSKTKRREILNLADDYLLTGFCLPGKPGIVCIEGLASDCNSWWMLIKAMNWKRIVCKFIDKDAGIDVTKFRKFMKFEELSFHCEGIKANHMDMGELLKYLEDHKCAYMFKELFGLDGKVSV